MIGIQEKENRQLSSKIDDLMRMNKKLKEEKATFVEANEKLIVSKRELEIEIRHFKTAIDSFSSLKNY